MGPSSSPPYPKAVQSLARTRPPPVLCPWLPTLLKRGVEIEGERTKVFLPTLHLLLTLDLLQPHHQPLQLLQSAIVAWTPGLNTGRRHLGISKHLSLGPRSFHAHLLRRSMGNSLPATRDNKGTFGITCPGDTSKLLRREALLPPRPSPRAPAPRIREGWGVMGAPSLPATTGGPARAKGPPPVWFLPGLHQVPQSLPVPWQPTLWVKAQEEQ